MPSGVQTVASLVSHCQSISVELFSDHILHILFRAFVARAYMAYSHSVDEVLSQLVQSYDNW
jgi:hypothetical protein